VSLIEIDRTSSVDDESYMIDLFSEELADVMTTSASSPTASCALDCCVSGCTILQCTGGNCGVA
jgi:hypothetical protein